MTKKEGRSGLASIEDCVNVTIKELEKYTKKNTERLITELVTTITKEITKGQTRKQQKYLDNKNGKKTICIDTSNDEQRTFCMR